MMGIFDIPPELLRDIASHIDIPTAIALSQASPHLETMADSRLYRDIVITHADQFAPLHNLIPTPPDSSDSSPSPSFQNRRTPHDRSMSNSSHPRPILQSRGSKTILRSHLSALTARPWRAAAVRKLDIELGQSLPSELDTLLDLVAPGLNSLRLVLPSHTLGFVTFMTDEARTTMRARTILGVLGQASRTFPNLIKADIEIGSEWGCLGILLKHAPGLRNLRVLGDNIPYSVSTSDDPGSKSSTPPSKSRSTRTRLEEDDDDTVRPHLSLEVLEISPVNPTILPFLARIISSSPFLQSITLKGPISSWEPGEDEDHDENPLISALCSLGDIRHLGIPSSCLSRIHSYIYRHTCRASDHPALSAMPGHVMPMQRLEHLDLTWNLPDLNAAAAAADSRLGFPSEGYSRSSTSLFPPFPNLSTCTLHLPSPDYTIGPGPGTGPGAWGEISSYDVFRGRTFDLSITAIRQQALSNAFETTPKLRSINLGHMYGMGDIQPAEEGRVRGKGRGKENWDHFDGVLITHFYNRDEQGERDHFCHLRHRSAFSCGWEHYGVLNGVGLKPTAYATLKDIDGLGLSKVKPGVSELSNESWEVLTHWTAQ